MPEAQRCALSNHALTAVAAQDWLLYPEVVAALCDNRVLWCALRCMRSQPLPHSSVPVALMHVFRSNA